MDLSQLVIGGEEEDDLTSVLSATLPDGAPIFSHAFSECCKWKTPKGYLKCCVSFDPKLKYDETSTQSSTNLFLPEISYSLTKFLCPEAMVQRIPTEDEVCVDKIVNKLPAKVLHQYFAQDLSRLEKYTAMLEKNARADFKEEMAITDALKTREFSFYYTIGIDSYPSDEAVKHSQSKAKTHAKEDANAVNVSRKERSNKLNGMLIFHIDGVHDSTPPPKKECSDAIWNELNVISDGKLEKLQNPDNKTPCKIVTSKEFPHTSALFFDQLGQFTSSVLRRRKILFEKSADPTASSSMLYR